MKKIILTISDSAAINEVIELLLSTSQINFTVTEHLYLASTDESITLFLS
jgi:hypothetical protein